MVVYEYARVRVIDKITCAMSFLLLLLLDSNRCVIVLRMYVCIQWYLCHVNNTYERNDQCGMSKQQIRTRKKINEREHTNVLWKISDVLLLWFYNSNQQTFFIVVDADVYHYSVAIHITFIAFDDYICQKYISAN